MAVISDGDKKLVTKLLHERLPAGNGRLLNVVKETLVKRPALLKLASQKPTPFYVFDQKELTKSIQEFKAEFYKELPDCQAYYAVKANPYPGILQQVVRSGLGLDVSSGRELQLAVAAKAQRIVFSGPGKTEAELKLAIKYGRQVIIHLDSFSELKLLAKLIPQGKKIRAGIRVHMPLHGSWRKFGISLDDLAKFWQEAKKYPQIELQGIQCHMSLNTAVTPYQQLIEILGQYLKKNFKPQVLAEIKFIDLGGGFCPQRLDGVYPWDTPQGILLKTAVDYYDQKIEFKAKYLISKNPSLHQYAAAIGQAVAKNLQPIVSCQYFLEPGRIIAAKSMHLVMKVADVKAKDMVILDGGINMVGWEYYLTNYYPVINLSRPAFKEIKVLLQGTLCLPDDFWGYYCYAKKIEKNDIIIIPNQGAYTYTWAQNFIKPIPPVYKI